MQQSSLRLILELKILLMMSGFKSIQLFQEIHEIFKTL